MKLSLRLSCFLACLGASLVACQPNKSPTAPQSLEQPAIITPDWSIAATLTALGNPPVAAGDLRSLPSWSVSPKLPDTVIDLGARYTPNPELAAQLSADLLIYSDFYEHLSHLGNTQSYKYIGVKKQPSAPSWQDYKTTTLALAQHINKEQEALDYISNSEVRLKALGQSFKAQYPHIKQLSIMQFGSQNQLYNYTRATPFGPAVDKMGLLVYDFGEANEWGSFIMPLADIVKLPSDACLVIVKPFSLMLKKQLAKNALWQALGYDTGKRCALVIDPVWAFGEFPSMVGFGENLVRATPYTVYAKQGGV